MIYREDDLINNAPEERLTFNAIYTKLRYNYKDYIKGEINEEEMSDYISKY